jgi:hypothetical protein
VADRFNLQDSIKTVQIILPKIPINDKYFQDTPILGKNSRLIILQLNLIKTRPYMDLRYSMETDDTPTHNFCTYPKEHKIAAHKYFTRSTNAKEEENIKIPYPY